MKQNEPIYMQLVNNIEKKIINGEYKVGDKIVSERKMSEQYGINRLTVRKALGILIERGCLSAEKGSGTYVKSIPNSASTVFFGSNNSITLRKQISKSGLKSTAKVISLKEVKNDENMKFDYKDLYELTRIFYIDNIPFSIQVTYLPKDVFGDIRNQDLQNGSLYEYMNQKGNMPVKFATEISVDVLPEQYIELLNSETSKHLFAFEYRGFNKDEKQIEYTISWYKTEYTKFKFNIN